MKIKVLTKTKKPERRPLRDPQTARIDCWLQTPLTTRRPEVMIDIIKKENPSLNIKLLQSARLLAKQRLGADKLNAETVLAFYNFLEQNSDLPIGPTSFCLCDSLEQISRQALLTRAILGDYLDDFYQDKEIVLEKIGDYTIKAHRHARDFGAGLICYSLYAGSDKIFEISFWPASPMVLMEIKSSLGDSDQINTAQHQKLIHKFRSKNGLSAPSRLILEFLKHCDRVDEEARISCLAKPWRDTLAEERLERADKDHQLAADDLGIEYEAENQRINEAISNLTRFIRNHDLDPGDKNFFAAFSAALKEQHLRYGNGDSWENFVAKVLFSRHVSERVPTLHNLHYYFFGHYPDIYQKAEPASFDFALPRFYQVDKKHLAKILNRYKV